MPVGGKPFLRRITERLMRYGFHDIVLCLGHGAAAIVDYFAEEPLRGAALTFSAESEPRGTAGALRVAEPFWLEQNLIMNGDTELDCDYRALVGAHTASGADVTIALAQVPDSARYGRVLCDAGGRVSAFLEKDGAHQPGLVNAGVYVAMREALTRIPDVGMASIERDWLPGLLRDGRLVIGVVVADGFTDIGTPDDYWRLANQS
jgi:NDP-sugar pyrophosphorylase family protein